jgi:hypothetical protein
MSSFVNTVVKPESMPMPDQKAFDKQRLPVHILEEIISAYNASIAKYDLNNYFEVGDFLYDLQNKLFDIVGDCPSLENYDLSDLPELVSELICEIFETQFDLNRKKHVLYNQKFVHRMAKKLRVGVARANVSILKSSTDLRLLFAQPPKFNLVKNRKWRLTGIDEERRTVKIALK